MTGKLKSTKLVDDQRCRPVTLNSAGRRCERRAQWSLESTVQKGATGQMSGHCVQSISEKCLCGSLCAENTNKARTPQPLGHYGGGGERNKILRSQGHTRTHIYKQVGFFFSCKAPIS